MTQYYNFKINADAIQHHIWNKKAYFRSVNAFSRISKNYDFRFQIFCRIDLVLPYICFRCGGGGASGTLSSYNILIQKSEIQRQQCSYDALVIKNNEAVLVIKWSAAQQNQQLTCAPTEDSDPPNLARVFAVRLTEVYVIYVISCPYSAQRRLTRLGGCPHYPESSLIARHFVCVVVLKLKCKISYVVIHDTHSLISAFAFVVRWLDGKIVAKMLIKVNRRVWFWSARTPLKTDPNLFN